MIYTPIKPELDAVEVAVVVNGAITDEHLFIFDTPGGRAMVDSATFLALYAPAGTATAEEKPMFQKTRKPRSVDAAPSLSEIQKEYAEHRATAQPKTMCIKTAILAALSDKPLTQPELIERVLELRPGTQLPSFYADVSTLRGENKIGKGDDMKWHLTGTK